MRGVVLEMAMGLGFCSPTARIQDPLGSDSGSPVQPTKPRKLATVVEGGGPAPAEGVWGFLSPYLWAGPSCRSLKETRG